MARTAFPCSSFSATGAPRRLAGARLRAAAAGLALLAGATAWAPAWAQQGSATVYRCPGPPVLYTDQISATEARDKGCRTIEGAAVTVVQAPPRPAAAPKPSANAASATGGATRIAGDGKVDPAEQRARDSDARRILAEELRKEEAKLEELRREFNNGEPERRGDERNFARYQERVAEMRAALQRKEADLAAIRRELGKLVQQ